MLTSSLHGVATTSQWHCTKVFGLRW
jgi:hypothetical protein